MEIATLNLKDGVDTILERLSTVCLTEELADVHFSFPQEEVPSIPGHKMILSLRSPVFKAMFHGTFPPEEGDVKILDIKADTFKMLIRYMYTDEVNLSGSSVIALLYAAQKYQLVSLLSKCEAYLSKQMSAVNACTIYAQAKLFLMHQLQEVALKFIAGKADNVFGGDDFLAFSPGDLIDILKLDALCISEVKIFKSVLKWTDRRLIQSRKEVTGKNRRDILLKHNILYMIGIPLLSLNDYTEIVLPSGVLTDEEQLHIFKVITVKDKQVAPDVTTFRMCPRKGIVTILVKHILPSVHVEDPIYRYDFRNFFEKAKLRQRATYKQNMGIGKVGQGQIMHIRPNSDIKVVSVNIKPRFHEPVHIRDFPKTIVNCRFAGKIFKGVCRHDGLKLEINQGVTSGRKVTINLTFEGDDEGIHAISVENITVPRDEYPKSYNQQNFSYTYNWSDDMYIDFEFSGVHLVDSIDICRL